MHGMKLEVFESHFLRDEAGQHRSFSSEPSFDKALSLVFDYFALVTVEEARELSGALSRGYNQGGTWRTFEPVSFAVVHNKFGEPEGVPLVLWMHGKAVMEITQRCRLTFHKTFPYISERNWRWQ